jgi:glycosyltransferase involved in cell wall biosynthesis
MTVSIVVPCYNAEAFAAEAIESVLAQSFADWDLLLVNDGSRDGTIDVLRRFARRDNRIRCLDLGSNYGISAARNFGTRVTRGTFLVHLDADDLLAQTALQEHVETMLIGGDVSYGGYAAFDKSPSSPLFTFASVLPSGNELLSMLVEGVDKASWWLPPGAVMVRRSADVRARHRFDVWNRRVPIAGEMHYYACLFRTGSAFVPVGDPRILLHYRKHQSSDSAVATFFELSLSYLHLLDFWIKELGDPELLRRKARLISAMEIASNVEAEFSAEHL